MTSIQSSHERGGFLKTGIGTRSRAVLVRSKKSPNRIRIRLFKCIQLGHPFDNLR
jgi:hypothetical protein